MEKPEPFDIKLSEGWLSLEGDGNSLSSKCDQSVPPPSPTTLIDLHCPKNEKQTKAISHRVADAKFHRQFFADDGQSMNRRGIPFECLCFSSGFVSYRSSTNPICVGEI